MTLKLSGEEYQDLKRRLSVKQGGRCAHCGKVKPLDLAHKKARGMAGAWREDTEANTHLLCRECHEKAGYEESKFGELKIKLPKMRKISRRKAKKLARKLIMASVVVQSPKDEPAASLGHSHLSRHHTPKGGVLQPYPPRGHSLSKGNISPSWLQKWQ